MTKKGDDDEFEKVPKVSKKEVFGDIRKVIIKGKVKDERKPTLSGDRVIIHDEVPSSKLYNKNFGELKKERLYLSLYEACLLLDENKIQVFDKTGREVSLKKLIKVGEKLNDNFEMKYDVFRDLRLSRGYVVKSGLKFGCDFVVYDRGKSPGTSHSKWMVHVIPEITKVDLNEMTRAARLATNVKKKMIFSIVTERGPVYYEIGRTKM